MTELKQDTISLEQEIEKARAYNYIMELRKRMDEIAQEHSDDIDLMINILNGGIAQTAMEQIDFEKSIGMRDDMYILK